MPESRSLALLAGSGELPLEFLKSAKNRGIKVTTFALKRITAPEVEELSSLTFWIEPFKLGKFLKELKKSGEREIVFLGKIDHKNALSLKGFDLKAVTFLMGLKDRKPESIITGIFKEVEKLGLRVIDPTPYLSHLLLPKGTVLGKKPEKELLEELSEGLKVAQKIASLDIGQTVVLKDKTVVAVEAVEGTDACIERGASLGGKGFVVCKAARKRQDMRVDVPTIGINTVKLIHRSGGVALALEAGKTYLLNRKEIEDFCRKEGFTLGAL
jgi:DUF1009 family protein